MPFSFLQQNLYRCIAFVLLVGATFWFLPDSYKSLPPITAENAFSILRLVMTYHLLLLSTFALGIFSRGPINRCVVGWFGVVMVLEYLIYYQGHQLATTTITHNLVGVLSTLFALLTISKRVEILLFVAQWMGRLSSSGKVIARELLKVAKPTDLDLLNVTYHKWFFILEVLTMFYCGLYLWYYDVPATASMYESIIDNDHIDYYPFYKILSDLLDLFWVTVALRYVFLEQRSPDALFGKSQLIQSKI